MIADVPTVVIAEVEHLADGDIADVQEHLADGDIADVATVVIVADVATVAIVADVATVVIVADVAAVVVVAVATVVTVADVAIVVIAGLQSWSALLRVTSTCPRSPWEGTSLPMLFCTKVTMSTCWFWWGRGDTGYLDWQFTGIKPKVVSVSPFKEVNISHICECKAMSSAPN